MTRSTATHRRSPLSRPRIRPCPTDEDVESSPGPSFLVANLVIYCADFRCRSRVRRSATHCRATSSPSSRSDAVDVDRPILVIGTEFDPMTPGISRDRVRGRARRRLPRHLGRCRPHGVPRRRRLHRPDRQRPAARRARSRRRSAMPVRRRRDRRGGAGRRPVRPRPLASPRTGSAHVLGDAGSSTTTSPRVSAADGRPADDRTISHVVLGVESADEATDDRCRRRRLLSTSFVRPDPNEPRSADRDGHRGSGARRRRRSRCPCRRRR